MRPNPNSEEYALARHIQLSHASPTPENRARADVAMKRLVKLGARTIRFYVRRAEQYGIDPDEATAYVIEVMRGAIIGYDSANPYIWNHLQLCLGRKLNTLIDKHVRQRDREVPDRECRLDALCDGSASHDVVMLAAQVAQAIPRVLTAQEQRLFWWLLDDGFLKDWAQAEGMTARDAASMRDAIRLKVQGEVGELL